MEKVFSNPSKPLVNEGGNYLVIISARSADNCNEKSQSCIIFTEGKSLEDAVALSLGLKHVLPAKSRVYVVHRDSLPLYTTSYTCVFDF